MKAPHLLSVGQFAAQPAFLNSQTKSSLEEYHFPPDTRSSSVNALWANFHLPSQSVTRGWNIWEKLGGEPEDFLI